MSINWESKQLLILGAGVTGIAVARTLASRGALVEIVDENPPMDCAFTLLRPEEIEISKYFAIVVSPGWRSDHHIITLAKNRGIEIFNEIDIAWNISQEISPHQKWLALTGTNGKTSTVEMTALILQRAGLNAAACGNVGDTVIDAVTHQPAYDFLILELSSFQLHWMKQACFVSAAILNIAEDHLDWHGSFAAYCQAKFSILDRAGIAILNGEDRVISDFAASYHGMKKFFSLSAPAPGALGLVEDLLVDRAFVLDPKEASMVASISDIAPTLPHNILNALAATALARSVNVSYADIRSALQEYNPGHHRIETILVSDGITWIDDSKATNPHAATASILSHHSVIWIAGGLAKGADMDSLVKRTKDRIKAVILIGEDRGLIHHSFSEFSPETPVITIDVEHVKGGISNNLMESVVRAAKKIAAPGDSVLLAPACASMDQFISYIDRGERFAEAARNLVDNEE